MDWITFAEFSLIGLFSGGLLALVALGVVLIYKGTRAINFAMGEFMMLGAYLVYTGHSWLELPLWLSVVFGLVGISLVAMVVERFVLRPLAGQPVVSVLMVTIGLGAFLHGAVDAIWGGQNLEMPQMLSRKPMLWGVVMVAGAVFWSFWVALTVFAGLSLYFRYSRTGIAMRAAVSGPITAYALGIDVRRTQQLTWIFAGCVGAVAGTIVASISSLSPGLGGAALGVLGVVDFGGSRQRGRGHHRGLVGWVDGEHCGGLLWGQSARLGAIRGGFGHLDGAPLWFVGHPRH